ncbi:Uncharacterised protein [[Actinobacillus] rossii]|uniref:Type IV secretion system putative lipoprotein virB7 n=1 Tax=[Actinobacillus] rossii TaxID=123820 RepID=A0A380U3X7_9PAST|nr:Uncharacterised protein [[Actinobacillus] rossii]
MKKLILTLTLTALLAGCTSSGAGIGGGFGASNGAQGLVLAPDLVFSHLLCGFKM